ncbi:LAMI_0E01706g1_1 [Lachancea mirantina]|uniref:LAMI_0E01706g1_1 n=1 Tax=Lachancea mirantina TaxID=1230905 RepID=A0A1G4JIS1_9SACH|nr:LAMI_0E01706g1_1 [Lachancea mirantina]
MLADEKNIISDEVNDVGSLENGSVREKSVNEADIDQVQYTAEEEKAVLRKIDRHLLPLICFIYFAQYLDKQSLTYTAVFGLKKDLKMVGTDYSWCTTIFYLGQLGANFVLAYLMTIIPRAPLTGACVVIWSVCCMCLAAPNTKQGFWVGRLFLGIFEAAVQPACVMITTYWYRKREQPLRTAIYISMNALAQIIGCYIMYGIGKTNSANIADWRVMFLICGALSLLAGLLFYFLLPASPKVAWFLTEREREIALKRIHEENDRSALNKFEFDQLKECLKFDWLFMSSFAFGFLVTVTSGPIIFQSLLLASFGYDKWDTMKYGSPAGALQLLFIWVGVLAVRLIPKERAMISACLVGIPLAGTIMLLCLKKSSGWWMIVASWMSSIITSFMTIILSLIASNVRGNTKKSLCSNAFYVGYCLAAIIYPQWWTGSYRGGLIVVVIMWIIMILLLIFYRFKAIYENKKKEKMELQTVQTVTIDDDLTDKANIHHRYVY